MEGFQQTLLYRCQNFSWVYCSHPSYSTKQDIAESRYRAYGVEQTDRTAAKRKSVDCTRAEDGENGRHIRTEAEAIPRVEGEMPAEEGVPEFCMVSAKTAPQLASTKASKEVKNIIKLVFDGNFDASALRRHMKRNDDC